MIKKIMLASCLVVTSMTSHAALISYNGYERDTANNYVTGGGLEWLMWDVTTNKSINGALAEYGADGWLLATNVQMASMFNVFKFNNTVWTATENILQNASSPWAAAEDGPYHAFLQLFGYTRRDTITYQVTDPLDLVAAVYGSDDDHDGLYKLARVSDDAIDHDNNMSDAEASLQRSFPRSADYVSGPYVGVALVRDARVLPPPQVSLPGSLSLLALSLVALGFRRRQA